MGRRMKAERQFERVLEEKRHGRQTPPVGHAIGGERNDDSGRDRAKGERDPGQHQRHEVVQPGWPMRCGAFGEPVDQASKEHRFCELGGDEQDGAGQQKRHGFFLRAQQRENAPIDMEERHRAWLPGQTTRLEGYGSGGRGGSRHPDIVDSLTVARGTRWRCMSQRDSHDGEMDEAPSTLDLTVGEAEAGQRLDVAMTAAGKAAGLVLSRTRIKALAEAGWLTLDGAPVADANRRLKVGQHLALLVPPAEEAEPEGEPIPLDVVFEDSHLIVIDKPAGLVVHPAPGHATGTLVNALIAHCGDSLSGIGGVRRPGIVHRLDKDTSGLLVVAKTDAAHQGLAKLFADHGRTLPLTRTYIAFVWGKPDRPMGTVETHLGRHATDRLRMAVVPEVRGRVAITHWRTDAIFADQATRIACDLETGRTHQIRVHMAHLGYPVIGDPLYGKGFRTKAVKLADRARAQVGGLGRQALHAALLGFVHPITRETLEFASALPPDLRDLEAALESGA